MEHGFWLERWREGRTGFHQPQVSTLLKRHWPQLGLAHGSKVFVPLAGKSLDMVWLAEQGHAVLGVELSPVAVQQFFAEHGWQPRCHESRHGRHYSASAIELICGDAFGLDAAVLQDCAAVYDRAALIALPPTMRAGYAQGLMDRLPAGCRGLLLTLEYAQNEMDGPPFAVLESEVRERYAGRWDVALRERLDILAQEPGFAARGVTHMATAVYGLQRLG